MFYSEKLNILFVACPKTGSKSVEAFFSILDPQGEKHRISLQNKVITSSEMIYGVVGHARAFELKKAMGEEAYNRLNTIGFARHPLDKLVASYYFSKKIPLSGAFKIKGKKRRGIRVINTFLTRLFPRILPFHLWAILFPLKTSREYFVDSNGKLIVDYIGRTENLRDDLTLICKQCGINSHAKEIPHINKTKHKHWKKYYKNNAFKNIMNYKYKKDIEFYKNVELNIEKMKTASRTI